MRWITIIAGIAAFVLSVFLSYGPRPSKKVRFICWLISALIVLMTVIGHWYEEKGLHLGLLGPDLSAAEGYDLIKRDSDYQDNLQLLEAIGSYYTCVRKPHEIFLQFCEWVFVFRSPVSSDLVEYRVFDSRLPDLPILSESTILELIREGGFTTYVVYNISPKALGMREIDNEYSAVHQYDAEGRVVVKIMGKALRHSFAEINEGPNEFVLSLTRACARPTDYLPKSKVIERWNRFGDVVIYRTTLPKNAFYEKLAPIGFVLDAQDAITSAKKAGAEFEVPGKRMVSIGAVRLYDGQNIEVPGPCWHLPIRMSLRPIVVHANSGRVYFVDDNGEYTAYWSIKHYKLELFVGVLFFMLLTIVLYAKIPSKYKSWRYFWKH